MELLGLLILFYIGSALSLSFTALFGLLTDMRRLARFAAWLMFVQALLFLGMVTPVMLPAFFSPAVFRSVNALIQLMSLLVNLAICVIPLLVLGWLTLRLSGKKRVRRLRFPRCHKCGYNLRGNVSGICPECGRPLAQPVDRDKSLAQRDIRTIVVFVCVAAIPFALWGTGLVDDLRLESPIELLIPIALMIVSGHSIHKLLKEQ